MIQSHIMHSSQSKLFESRHNICHVPGSNHIASCHQHPGSLSDLDRNFSSKLISITLFFLGLDQRILALRLSASLSLSRTTLLLLGSLGRSGLVTVLFIAVLCG